ncbi:MAG TPA: hypothetical protein VMR25_17620, partial [Planctomycetaceae bacterium]|nr:hypothetical protein [Planctomycetaceae bacterium]
MSSRGHKRQLLFVVSNDYGELSTALDFLAGQPFDAQILMPDCLYRANGESLPVSCRAYNSLADILSVVTTQSPDVVFLFSGYLYAVNGLLSLDAVRQLVETLRSATRDVVTSDPFLGQLFRLDPSTFSDHHPARRQLVEHFAQVVPILEGVKHLYRVAPRAGATAGSISFYNPDVVLNATARAAWHAKAINTPG